MNLTKNTALGLVRTKRMIRVTRVGAIADVPDGNTAVAYL